MESSVIRKTFIDFFVRNGHRHIESSSLIPINDPTLLFANAGMNQFKDFFTGVEQAPFPSAVTSQKCVRAGGKHNDLDNVGFTARHHTFFEMLGNFSFGDYFKEEAIRLHWKLFTEIFKIPREKLYITVHDSDEEALQIWHKQIGLPLDRIFKKGDKDNFWAMGDSGPCGPCTEIFFDWGPEYSTPGFDPSSAKDILEDDRRYVELANLVFMQFEATPNGRIPLPRPSVDTGAGLERLSAALQGKYWNYDTDCFSEIIKGIENLSGKKYSDPKYQSSFRVVADHIRSCTMLITDGAIPSNEGRGYVLRRIIRRAVRHLRELGVTEVSFYKLVPTVFAQLGSSYPENLKNKSLAEKFLQIEEKKFLETLEIGLKFLEDAIKEKVSQNILPGETAFRLYDTFGFPMDLTQVICAEKGIKVDQVGFEKSMAEQRQLSKRTQKAQYGDDLQKIFSPLKEKLGVTHFLGYKALEIHSQLLAIQEVGELKGLIFKETPFYPEGGGQIGDTGEVLDDEHVLAHIIDTQRPTEGLVVHFSKDSDALEVGKSYILKVSNKRRKLIARNHSATHLLQAALIKVLGPHIKQAGSSVNEDRLRFDFSHPQAMSEDEIIQVEQLINKTIQNNIQVTANTMSKEKAQQVGALAFFGEKYGAEVRVIQMENFSIELCGGTHIENTQEIGFFSIVSESALSSGVRRIEAVTSEVALNRLQKRSRVIDSLEKILSSSESQLTSKIIQIQDDLKSKNREINNLKEKIDSIEMGKLIQNVKAINGFNILVTEVSPSSDLKKLSDQFSSRYPEGICLIYSIFSDKINLLLKSGQNKSQLDCGKFFKENLPLIDGRGGGKKDLAQGSGNNPSGIQKIVSIMEKFLTEAK